MSEVGFKAYQANFRCGVFPVIVAPTLFNDFITCQSEEMRTKLMKEADVLVNISLLAKQVRAAQKAYFADRNKDNLIKSKTVEGQLDKLLKELE